MLENQKFSPEQKEMMFQFILSKKDLKDSLTEDEKNLFAGKSDKDIKVLLCNVIEQYFIKEHIRERYVHQLLDLVDNSPHFELRKYVARQFLNKGFFAACEKDDKITTILEPFLVSLEKLTTISPDNPCNASYVLPFLNAIYDTVRNSSKKKDLLSKSIININVNILRLQSQKAVVQYLDYMSSGKDQKKKSYAAQELPKEAGVLVGKYLEDKRYNELLSLLESEDFADFYRGCKREIIQEVMVGVLNNRDISLLSEKSLVKIINAQEIFKLDLKLVKTFALFFLQSPNTRLPELQKELLVSILLKEEVMVILSPAERGVLQNSITKFLMESSDEYDFIATRFGKLYISENVEVQNYIHGILDVARNFSRQKVRWLIESGQYSDVVDAIFFPNHILVQKSIIEEIFDHDILHNIDLYSFLDVLNDVAVGLSDENQISNDLLQEKLGSLVNNQEINEESRALINEILKTSYSRQTISDSESLEESFEQCLVLTESKKQDSEEAGISDDNDKENKEIRSQSMNPEANKCPVNDTSISAVQTLSTRMPRSSTISSF